GCNVISMLNAALVGAGLMLITGCLNVNQAERSLDLTVIITIAASFALGVALQKTGVAAWIAGNIVHLSDYRPWLMLVLTYVAVSLLTEVITNNAAAVIMVPIVIEITEKAVVTPEPFIFAIMMAASASFATPLGYQTNLMVSRVGVPMNILIGAATIAVLLVLWPL